MSKSKILVVDDEKDIVKAVGMRLRSAGYEVISASDGVSGTQLAVKEAPDLIILDIGMPGGDGHTVLERLKNNLKTMSIPVIFLTARVSDYDMERASDAGAVGYLSKPFDSQRLLHMVEEVLSGPLARSHFRA